MTTHTERLDFHDVSPRAKKVLTWGAVLMIGAAVVIISLLVVMKHHRVANEEHAREHAQAQGIALTVEPVAMSSADREITLPGDVHGFQQITLYAKIAGYLKHIDVERGQWVKAGTILGQIESPETDQQVLAALSDAEVKKQNAKRAEILAGPGVVSAQDRDNAVSAEGVSRAQLAEATSLRGYEIVRAPFDGVVTARYVDDGALLPAATNGTQSAQPLVDIAEVDLVRVFVYVGQDVAPFLHEKDDVTLWQDETPEKQIHAQVTRFTQALDMRTRTMLCEIDLDNRNLALYPGTFVRARLHLKVPPSPQVSNESLVIRNGKNLVAVVNDNKVHFVPVELGFTDGKVVRVTHGLAGGESVGVDVPMELAEGMTVRPQAMKKGDAAGGDKNGGNSAPNGGAADAGTEAAASSL